MYHHYYCLLNNHHILSTTSVLLPPPPCHHILPLFNSSSVASTISPLTLPPPTNPTGSPYTSAISSAILSLQETSSIELLKRKWWSDRKGGKRCLTNKVIWRLPPPPPSPPPLFILLFFSVDWFVDLSICQCSQVISFFLFLLFFCIWFIFVIFLSFAWSSLHPFPVLPQTLYFSHCFSFFLHVLPPSPSVTPSTSRVSLQEQVRRGNLVPAGEWNTAHTEGEMV